MDLGIRRTSVAQDDQSWLGSAHGTDAPQSITLDVTTFTAGTHYPEGWLKSGLPLRVVTPATGTTAARYGLWTTTSTLAGFLFTTTQVPAGATKVGGSLLEHGRVKIAKLPVSVDAAGQTSAAGRIIFA